MKQTIKNPLKQGMKSADVKVMQEWLCYHGFPVVIDSEFGPATDAALLKFLNRQGIVSYSEITQSFFDLLQKPLLECIDVVNDAYSLNTTIPEIVVKLALFHLSWKPIEIGGQNTGPWVRYYMNGNEGEPWAWCAGFVTKILQQAYTVKKKLPFIRGSFSCDELAAQAKGAKAFMAEGYKPKPGDIMLVRKSPSDWTHTGIVISVENDSFTSIEGNTNDTGSREGIAVCRMTRGYKNKDFICVPT